LNRQPKARRVLVADDHEPTREEVRRALDEDERFDVRDTAADAAAAVSAAVRGHPDICLLDVRMPGGGIAAAWEITARLPQAKIVMLTVSDEDADLFAALRAGADGYLLKTMNLRRLPDALERVCNGEAAISGTLLTRVLEQFRSREPRWRHSLSGAEPARRLTSREWEVLELLALGRSTSDIAQTLMLSASAVRVHIAAIVRKLGVANRAAVVALFRGGPGR
jgi:two-component system, NarL family, nitrate/nitrite response regulator NarL